MKTMKTTTMDFEHPAIVQPITIYYLFLKHESILYYCCI